MTIKENFIMWSAIISGLILIAFIKLFARLGNKRAKNYLNGQRRFKKY